MPRFLAALVTLSAMFSPIGTTVLAAEFRTLERDGKTLDYFLVLPDNFHAGTPYPVLLALPPGDQGRKYAETALDKYWEAEAKTRGWVVISPVAQGGRSFHSGLERAIPSLLDEVSKTVVFEAGRVHLAGVSNGGKSAYRIATEYPDRFVDLLVLPGSPPDDRAVLGLRTLKQLPAGVHAFVGADDVDWLSQSQRTKQQLDAYGVLNTLEVLPGEGHVLTLKAIELYDLLDKDRPVRTAAPVAPAMPTYETSSPTAAAPVTPAPAPTPPPTAPPVVAVPVVPPPAQPAPAIPAPAPSAPAAAPASAVDLSTIDEEKSKAAINAILDDFHDAAAKADEARYFGHMAPEFVFLGTDATERWPLKAFRDFAHPLFEKGKGWAYRSHDRFITIAPLVTPGAEVAWFDEMLDNDHLGVTRGSGVLRNVSGEWKLTQYNLSIPVPNDLVDQFVPKIREKTGAASP